MSAATPFGLPAGIYGKFQYDASLFTKLPYLPGELAGVRSSNPLTFTLNRTRPVSNPDESESASPLQSYLELLRLPNVFTAVADVAMGFFFVQAGRALGLQRRRPAVAPADRPMDGRPAGRGIRLALLGRHGAQRRL